MAMVCNNIEIPLVVSMSENCAQFSENVSFPSACGAGSATKTCNIAISGGLAPYTTTFSYSTTPTPTGCTLNSAAFVGGSGASPQFGFGFTASNMCQLSISGSLTVTCVVQDSSGQVVTQSKAYPVSIDRYVVPSGGTGGGGGGGTGGGGSPPITQIQ